MGRIKDKFFICFFVSFGMFCASSGSATELSGPRYQMFFVNSTSQNFNPEQDILNPTEGEQVLDAVRGEVLGAGLKSFLPFIQGVASSDDAMEDRVLLMISNFRQSVSEGVLKSVSNKASFPLRHSFMLMPNLSAPQDVFYSSEKISMSATDIVNIFSMTPSHPKFQEAITTALKAPETMSLIKAPGSQLLAARTDLEITSVSEATARLQVVLVLEPQTSPFHESNEKVKFERLVIPELSGARRPVAVLDFKIDLSQQKSIPPELTIHLGELDKFENGEFLIKVQGRRASVPRLEGQANKAGAKFVAVNIGFEVLKFNLETLQLSAIDTVTRAGIRLGQSQFVVGGFHLESVDQEFQKEINSKIDGEVKKAKDKAAESIDSGLVTRKWLALLLERILQ